jgi:hypothetical protein
MNFLKQFIRAVAAAAIGFPIVMYLKLEGFLLMFFFFGIYIAVSLIIEAVWVFFTKKYHR